MKAARRHGRTDLRWILIAAGIAALQAGVVLLLSDRSPAAAIPGKPVPRMQVVSWDLGRAWSDPLLLAFPTANGFAGIGWRAASDPQYVARDWTEPMPWLGQSETGLARVFLAAAAVGIGRGVTADKPAPELIPNQVPAVPLAGQTEVRLDGHESDWELAAPLLAPSITHSNVLGETVVQAAVDRSGQVFSAVVLKSSGLKAADQQALELARTARFRRMRIDTVGGREWAWARLIFEWRTLAPGQPAEEGAASSQ
jgi:TonB family protein